MQTTTLDQTVSELIFGTSIDGFHPSTCERDAWIVVDWMLHQKLHLDFHKLNPLQICRQAVHINKIKTNRFTRAA